jgi:hypothetical protein
MASRLDQAAAALNLCRSDVIRRCLTRDLEFVERHEIESAQRLRKKISVTYIRWIKAKVFERWLASRGKK